MMKQVELFEKVSLPKKRSRNFNDKPLFQKKELTDKQKSWLHSHEVTNWKQVELFQRHKTSKNVFKTLRWKLTGTEKKKDTCGIWNTKGCSNIWGHPENKVFVRRSKPHGRGAATHQQSGDGGDFRVQSGRKFRQFRPRQRPVGGGREHLHRESPDERGASPPATREGGLGLLRGGVPPQLEDELVESRFPSHRLSGDRQSSREVVHAHRQPGRDAAHRGRAVSETGRAEPSCADWRGERRWGTCALGGSVGVRRRGSSHHGPGLVA